MSGRLVFFSSATGDGAPRIYTLARHVGWDVVKAMAATKPMRAQSPQVITQVLERGERGVAFLQNDNIAWRSKLQGKPTDYVFPAEGVPTELGACGLLANSPRPQAAALFFEWWMSPEGQAILVKGGKYSSRTDVDPPTGSTPLSKLKLLTLGWYEDRTKSSTNDAIFGGEWKLTPAMRREDRDAERRNGRRTVRRTGSARTASRGIGLQSLVLGAAVVPSVVSCRLSSLWLILAAFGCRGGLRTYPARVQPPANYTALINTLQLAFGTGVISVLISAAGQATAEPT